MKLTLINQYYPPDLAPTGQMAASLAEHRSSLGDEVTVITSAGGYAGSRVVQASTSQGEPRIVRLPTFQLGRANLIRKGLDYMAFYIGAFWHMLRLSEQDVVIALTTPPWIGWAGWIHKRRHRSARLMIWTMDVHPEAAEKFGVIRAGGLLSRIARAASRGLLTRSDAVVTLDSAMRDLLNSHYPLDQTKTSITVIPNWEPRDPANESKESSKPLAGISIERQFTILYMGNAGRGHDFATVLKTAYQLRKSAVAFVFVGGGPQWEHLKREKTKLGLEKLHFQDYVPQESREAVMRAADCGLIALRHDALGIISPSKLHGYLAMGLPVIYLGPEGSNVDDVIEAFGCGFSLRQGDAEGLTESIMELASNTERKNRMSMRARGAFEARYSAEIGLGTYDEFLVGLVGSG